ncbi:hypothetical protein JKF63_07863 [Porcisia hertigi]|uniref:Uncharacterized protein n=1 Tax=Porcisia hertigi TaxID=2761500 RepID=A0A836LJN2_9TRYP|nr:hypothetical protein JKF63_07863 [Porcisia hertigi]
MSIDSEERRDVVLRAAPATGVTSAGLVSSNVASRSATTPISRQSLEEGQVLQAAAQRRAPPVALKSQTHFAATDPPGSAAAAAAGSTAVSVDVGGVVWQKAFAAHAQQLLCETRQQVHELRRYQQKALREAQRADSLAAANCALEAQLIECKTKRAEERTAHKGAVTALSQQVLLLEESLGDRGREAVELQRQIRGIQAVLAHQEAVHQRELQEVRCALEGHVEKLVAEQDRQREQWREERQCLEREKAERASAGGTASSAHETCLDTRCPEREPPRKDEAPTSPHATWASTCEEGKELTAAATRFDAATSMDEMQLHTTPATSLEGDASPYSRVHRDVLAQQQPREGKMLSQPSIGEATLQPKSTQQQVAEKCVVELLEQNEHLRDALATARAAAVSTAGHVLEPVGKEEAAMRADKRGRDSFNTTDEATLHCIAEHDVEHPQHPQHGLLQEIRDEYTALRRESALMLSRHKARQHQETVRWTAVRSALCAALDAAGLRDAQCALDAAGAATGTSDLRHDSESTIHSTEGLFKWTLAALDTLVGNLRSQREAAAAEEAVRLERQRLSALEEALRELQAQNQAHIASLDATKAELYNSRCELEASQQSQKQLAARQDARDEAWRAGKMQLKRVTDVLQRALREYARPLPASVSASSFLVEDGASEDVHGADGRAVKKRGSRPLKQLSRTSPTPAAADAVVPCEAAACAGYREDNTETVADSADTSPSQLPYVSDASFAPSSLATHLTSKSLDADGDAEESNIRHDMAALEQGLLKLLTAWRRRQHTLIEANKATQRYASNLMAENRALSAKQQESDARRQEQLRLSRAAGKRHTHQLEEAQRALEELQQQARREGAQARQQAAVWEGERDALRRRLRVAEEKLDLAEQTLVKVDVDQRTQCASHAAQAHALSDVAAARDRLERRQADLCEHVEDLETQLLVSERAQKALHALITTAVAFIVRLLVDHQQLQDHYRVLRALAAVDAQTASMVERVLESRYLSNDGQATAEGCGKGLTPPMGAVSEASAWPAVTAPPLIAPAPRFRAAVHAVRAVLRLSWLLTARQCLRCSVDARRRDEAVPSAAAVTPAAWQPLLVALSSAFMGSASAPVPSSAMTPSRHNLLRLYTASPDSCALPVVHLPPALELASMAFLGTSEEEEEEVGGRGEGPNARFDLGSCAGGAEEGEKMHISAGHQQQQQQLVQLLAVAKLDVEAPTTQHLCAKAVAAGSVSALAATELLQLVRMRRAFSERLWMPRVRKSLSLLPPTPEPALRVPDLHLLLPDRVAVLLQMQLEQATTQARRAAESDTLLRDLVQQNETLLETLRLRTEQHNATSVELQSLASQLELQQAVREEQKAVQERILETRSSLLQERRLRREAEERLAELQLARLQWLGDQERYKREVYALNMELANTSVGSPSPAAERARTLRPACSNGAGPAIAKSALSIQVDDTITTDTAHRPESGVSQIDVLSGSSMKGNRIDGCDGAYRSHPPALHDAPALAGVRCHQDDENYYYKLLRGDHQSDDDADDDDNNNNGSGDARNRSSGGTSVKKESLMRDHAHGGIPPLPTLQYRPRSNLPTPQDLTQDAQSGEDCFDDAAARTPRWGAQLQPRALSHTRTHSRATADVSTLIAGAGAKTPPTPRSVMRSRRELELYIPKVARHRERARSSDAQACEAHWVNPIATANPAQTEVLRRPHGESTRELRHEHRPLQMQESLGHLQRSAAHLVEPTSAPIASAHAALPTPPQGGPASLREKPTPLGWSAASTLPHDHDHCLDPARDASAGDSHVACHVSSPLYYIARSAQ